jgi:hypothetical protein
MALFKQQNYQVGDISAKLREWLDLLLKNIQNASHNNLNGLQGGTSSERNHLTDAQVTKLDGIEDGATADMTAAEIKTAYESNANTNAFTDAEQTKLAGIESGADATDAENVGAAITGAGEKTAPVDADTAGLIDGAASNALKKLTFANLWAWIKGKIEGATFATLTVTSADINGGTIDGVTSLTTNTSGGIQSKVTAGGGVEIEAGGSPGGWARGFVATDGGTRTAGIGFLGGSGGSITSLNIGIGDGWWTSADRISLSASGVTVGAPTGGGQGQGTLNAKGLYDDGVLTTDYVFDGELDGYIDTGKWDAAVPDRVKVIQSAEPERIEKRVVTQPQQVPELQWDNANKRFIRRLVIKDVPVRDRVPIFDDKGKQVGETEIDRTEEITIPAQQELTETEVRTHEPARQFKLNMDELDPAIFAAKWKADRKLPAFKRGPEKKSLGEFSQALLETCEVLAVHNEKFRQEIAELRQEIAALKGTPL